MNRINKKMNGGGQNLGVGPNNYYLNVEGTGLPDFE